MSTAIRVAEPRDVALLESIENAADAVLVEYLDASVWDPAPSGDSRVSAPGFVLVAAHSSSDEPVGFVHVLEIEGIAHLEQLSVLPEHGRRGVGRALVQAALAEGAARGYRELTLRTYADVPWNAPFYSTCGFTVTEPASGFHRALVETEDRLGLNRWGDRVQMTATLTSETLRL